MEYKKVLLLKYGEIVLKGLNKSQFENVLIKNIKYRLKAYGNFKVSACQSTIYISPVDDGADVDSALDSMCKVFGISKLCMAYEVIKDINAISEAAKLIKDKLCDCKTFKVETKRSDKKFPMQSPMISAEIGGVILDMLPHLKVDVYNPEITVYVEIRETAAYIHAGTEKGAGGLPVGTAGKALLLLSGGIDSPVAGYMMSKRGVSLEALHFESYPYTSELALKKVVDLANIMKDYCGSFIMHSISVKEIQESIRDNCNEEYFTLLLRRFMMRIASKIAGKTDSQAIITGESLGQVASQTMLAMTVTENAADHIVFRPLIGLDKEEIVQISRKIGTFETSILPYEDCCTVFTPSHPVTKPKLSNILEQEAKIDCDALIEKAMQTEKTYII